MIDEINRNCDENVRDKLVKLWETQIHDEVIKSERILEKKEKWLNDYGKNYGNAHVKIKQNNRPGKSDKSERPSVRNRINNDRSYADVVANGDRRDSVHAQRRDRPNNYPRSNKIKHGAVNVKRASETERRTSNITPQHDRDEDETALKSAIIDNDEQSDHSDHFLWERVSHKSKQIHYHAPSRINLL